MIRANNPEIDFQSLNARVQAVAARLRDLNVVEERRRERADESELSVRTALARNRAVNALLDRAEDLNQPRQRLPRRLDRLHKVAPRPARFVVRLFNYIFRAQRDVNEAQIQAVRELSQTTLILGRRLVELERELEQLRKLSR